MTCCSSFSIYFKKLFIDGNLELSLTPKPSTATMIEGATPAAINPYSVAPAAALCRNLPTYFKCQPAPDLKGG
jgi:hypothetical protein